MFNEMIFVFVVIGVAAALMASNRVRFDVVALLVVLALMLSGILTPGEALAGFGSSVVILVAALLVVGEMLDRTGVARAVGDFILKRGGKNETKLLAVIMVSAALLGSVMSSTAVVAIFIPIVLRIAAVRNLNASRMLIPMSYASLISGMLTLIASPPNLVVHEELKESGYSGFGFFSFSLVGLGVLVVAVVYVLLIGRRLLSGAAPEASPNQTVRSARQVWQDFNLEETVQILRVEEGSPLAGTSLAEAGLREDYQLRILGIRERDSSRKEALVEPTTTTVIHSGEELIVAASPENAARFGEEKGLSVVPLAKRNDRQQLMREIGVATVLVHPDSGLKDKSLREANFRSRFGLHVIGVRRQQKSVQDFEDSRIEASDTLLVFGPWSRIEGLKERTHDFIMLELPSEHADVVPASRRMPVALAILVAMVLLTAFNVVPLVAAVIMAVMAAVATRCLTMDDSYRAVHWNSLVLVAGMLPLADALVATGGSELIVDTLMSTVGTWGPHAMFTTLFFLTAGLGLVLSNTASAVLVAPIAITAANQLEVSPYPFAIAVLIAASAAFVTPISTPVVTLVVAPGNYKFFDFVKVGVPLLLLTYVVTILLAPLVFPY